jgi:CheY-like chemotaxis protein
MEMAALSGGPHSLVIGLQSEIRQAASQMLARQTGAEVTEANSGQSALLALQGNKPIELIFIVDRVSDMSIFELLQRLRKTKNGQSLPLAVLTDSLYPHERRLISDMPGVVTSVLSRDPQHIERVVGRLLAALDTRPMSAGDRSQFAQGGAEFLAKLAGDRGTYSFYPLSDWREQLISAQGSFPLAAQMDLFAALGAAEGQTNLVSLAATPSLSEAERMAAAGAFAKSVRRFGMLMSRQDVLRNYELYNQLGPKDPVAAKALGLVLDVTEAQAGKADWPEGH